MKNSTRFCILTLVLSMLLAFVIFTLSAGGILVLDTSSRLLGLLITFSCILLSALLLGSLLGLLVGGVFCLLHGLSSQGQENRRTDAENAPRMAAGTGRFGSTRTETGNPGTGYPGNGYSSGCSGTGVSGMDYSRTGYTGTGGSANPSRTSFRRGYEEREVPEDSFFGRRPPL